MSATLGSFTAGIAKLTDKFEADRAYYLSKGYSEAQARVDFITPFFKALGWDVGSEVRLAQQIRAALVERDKLQSSTDYAICCPLPQVVVTICNASERKPSRQVHFGREGDQRGQQTPT